MLYKKWILERMYAAFSKCCQEYEGFWHSSRSYLGLIIISFFTSNSLFSSVWEKPIAREEFNFCGLNSITYSYFSSEKWKLDLESILKEINHDRSKLIISETDSLDINAINSTIKFYIVLNKVKDGIYLLSMDAKVNAVAKNQEQAFAYVWRRECLIESEDVEKETKKQVRSTLVDFLADYFKTNSCSKEKTCFYVIP